VLFACSGSAGVFFECMQRFCSPGARQCPRAGTLEHLNHSPAAVDLIGIKKTAARCMLIITLLLSLLAKQQWLL
jgi:hypothetical protein